MEQKPYEPAYESPLARGVAEDPRPWDLAAYIDAAAGPDSRILDIGCGTAMKILPFAPRVREIVGVEPSPSMRARAMSHVGRLALRNVHIIDGRAENLPVPDESFDLLTSMLAAGDSPDEAYRVLEPGGHLILEKLGEQDKARLKSFFGSDKDGPRGQLSELRPGERLRNLQASYARRFTVLLAREGTWDTFYTREGLKLLLENTPVVRGFNIAQDAGDLDEAAHALMTPRGICVPQHRVLIVARKELPAVSAGA